MSEPPPATSRLIDSTNGLAARMLAGFAGPVFLIDGGTRKVVDCNQAALDVFGYSREELVEHRLLDHTHGADGGKLANRLEKEAWQAYETAGVFQTRIAFPSKAGLSLPCDLTGLAFFARDGRLDAIIVTLVDRSVEAAREAELSRLVAGATTLAAELAAIARPNGGVAKGKSLSSMGFTPRQVEILRLSSSGASAKEIAFTLGIAESTVKNHLSAIYRKLGVKSKIACVDFLAKRRIRLE